MSNWGIAQGRLFDGKLTIDYLSVVKPTKPSGKQVRVNSADLAAAEQLAFSAFQVTTAADVVFVEVPVGSQSARAMASYGICVGILGALRAKGIPFFEVTPTEVKLASGAGKAATKLQMIGWASKAHPEANWPTYTKNGATLITESTAEHMADAIGAIHAGLELPAFKQMQRLAQATSLPSLSILP